MKKYLFPLLLAVLVSCSESKDEPEAPAFNAEELKIAACLNGSFSGSSFSSSTNTTETEELSFSPFAEPRKMSVMDYVGVGGVSMQIRDAWVLGSAVYTKYVNDHLLETSKKCYYSVSVPYSGASAKLELYPYGDNGEVNNHTESFTISSVTAISFVMRPYGTGEGLKKILSRM